MKTVAAVFASLSEAEHVVAHLERLGIASGEIHVVAGKEAADKTETGTTEATVDGARFGGGMGILAGLVFLAIPGVGPIIAGGAMATVLTGLGIGAATGGLLGAFKNLGISHDEAGLYEEAIRRGKAFVGVHVHDEGMEEQVSQIMADHGAQNIRHVAETWSDPADSSIKWHEEPEDGPILPAHVRIYPHEKAGAGRP